MKWIVYLLIFLCNNSFAQIQLPDSSCRWSYEYYGPPGDIKDYFIDVLPGTLLQIDFCTYNVPDQFHIGNLIFDIGGWNLSNSIPPKYRGYCEFWFENNELQIIENQSGTIPDDIACASLDMASGTMRLYYRIPDAQCDLEFSVWGNKQAITLYSLCIKIIESEYFETDTAIVNVCDERNDELWFIDCHKLIIKFINHSIQSQVKIKNPSCLGKFDGSIEFEKYPEKNVYGLKEGRYEIYINNGFCDSLFIFNLEPLELCDWYIPNAFTPNNDGFNEIFMLFTRVSYPYHLEIFDRWGDCVFSGEFESNYEGWDGRFNGQDAEVGVYVWKITCIDKNFSGDVTLIR